MNASALQALSLRFAPELAQVRTAILAQVDQQLPFLPEITAYMLESQAVPMRALVLLLTGKALGTPAQPLAQTASLLEYLHAASVLHQDVTEPEAFRRVGKSFQSVWGNEAGVLIGDYLLAIVFETATKLENLELLEALAFTTSQIARGQVLEISTPPLQTSVTDYLKIIEYKSASLLATAAQSAALWGGSSAEIQKKLLAYGLALGMLWQLQADFRIWNDAGALLQQLQRGQTCFPWCLFWEVSAKQAIGAEFSSGLQPDLWNETMLGKVKEAWEESSALAQMHQQMALQRRQALEALQGLPQPEFQPLYDLIESITT